jgi:hypothetical protein
MLSYTWLLAATALLATPATCDYPSSVVFPPGGLNVYASSSPFACTSAVHNSLIPAGAYYCSWLQNDGNFVTYYFAGDGSSEVIFTSQTQGYYCPDGDNVCNLVYQWDMNLVLYIGGIAVWASDTVSSNPYNLVFSGGARPMDIAGSWPSYPHPSGKKTLHSYYSAFPPTAEVVPPPGHGCQRKRGAKDRRVCV